MIATGTSTDRNSNTFVHDLTWPTWRKSAIAQRDWDAADSAGRIKVELAAGFKEQLGGKVVFTTLSTIVCFAFFPAPIGKTLHFPLIPYPGCRDMKLMMDGTAHLERVGIAWPNPKMFEKPLHSEGNLIGSDSNNAQEPGNVVHRRTYSNSNSSDDSDSEVEVTTQKAAEKRIDGSNLMDDKNGASTLRQTYDATTDTSLDALTKTKTSGGKAASSSGTTALKLRTSRPPIASTRSGYKSPGTSPIAQTSQEPTQLLPSASFQPAAKSKHSVKKSRKT